MTLLSGTRLGPYEIVAPIGAGGMGEVWRAIDSRLERQVAIKVLPPEFASDTRRRLRFQREAKTISQLSHPNICTLHDVGEIADAGSGSVPYLVMELLDGESLAERLEKGPLPIDQVLTYGTQIAAALDCAHRAGVVHRDLKPGNVMLTKSGAKLLDFGLAKAHEDVLPSDSTLTLTQEGTIVGTFQYMAPEQLEGGDADARTDIFALGTVLYEMATGKRAFEPSSKAGLIAAIVTGQPAPMSEIQPLAPPAFEHAMLKCLAKQPDDRWQSAHDVAEELKWIGSQIGVGGPVAARRRSRERLEGARYLLLVVVAVASTWGVIRFRAERPRLVVTTISPPDRSEYAFAFGDAPAISPDGLRIAFVAETEKVRRIWVRSLSDGSAQPLAESEYATGLFWSPDSRKIGFFSGHKMKKIDANGGPAQTLCDAWNPRGGTWSRDGAIVFAPKAVGPLYRVSDSGGVPSEVTQLHLSHTVDHHWPWFLPDGRHFLYLAETGWEGIDQGDIMVGSIDDPLEKKLVSAVRSNVAWSRSGYLLYYRDRSLVAQKLDVTRLEVDRDVIPIAKNVALNFRYNAMFSVSDHGELIYQTGDATVTSQLAWFDAAGKRLENVGKPADIAHLELSHDGRRVAVAIGDAGSRQRDIWIEDVARGTPTRLTFEAKDNQSPVWSADDTRIAYAAGGSTGKNAVMVKRSSGTGAARDRFHFIDGLPLADQLVPGWCDDPHEFSFYSWKYSVGHFDDFDA